MTTSFFHPSLLLIIGACFLPLIKGPLRKSYLLAVPLLTFFNVIYLSLSPGTYGIINFMGQWQLTFGRIDSLSIIFAIVMSLMGIIGTIYGLHVKDNWQHIASWFYVSGSIGAIFAGDYLVLFLFWEMMAFSSTFLIWFNRDKDTESLAAGYRYLLVHTFGGVLLLLGFVLRYQVVGDLAFVQLDPNNTELYSWLIMAGLMLNAAVIPFHSWLPDAYSKATITGSVFMCAFTTKTAIYTLARACAGFEILIYLGVGMAIYGIIYAMLENDIRKLLGWEIVSQVGYMVAGVGIGTALAINGTCAHAFAHILYKGLLFMAAGALIHSTGKSKLSELGNLYRAMPSTMIFMLVGGISVSAFPFFSGFVSKSMIISASFEHHMVFVGFLLTMVSVGTFIVAGLRLPYFIFFNDKDRQSNSPIILNKPSWNMNLAMVISSVLCFLIGTYYQGLYSLLPFPEIAYHPYSSYHLSETLQLLVAAAFMFYLLKSYLKPENTISLDLDWFYRKGGQIFLWLAKHPFQWIDECWGAAYKVVGLYSLMTTAKFWSWFDWNGIDGVVDGSAKCVRAIGKRVTVVLQRGQIQQTIYISLMFTAILLISYIWR